MKNNLRLLFIVLHSSFFILLGCSVKRESQLSAHKELKAVYRQTDSLQLLSASREWGNKTVDIRHIEWLPPDSCNRQFVRAVTLIRVEDEKEEESFSSLSTETEAKAILETSSEVLETERVEKKKKSPRLFLIITGFVLGLCILKVWSKR